MGVGVEKRRKIDKVIEHRKKVADMYKNILKDLDREIVKWGKWEVREIRRRRLRI